MQPKLLEAAALLAAQAPAEVEDVRRAPVRSLANVFVNTCWRNGPIEDLHAGEADRVRLWERRFTSEEARGLEEDAIARFMDAIEAYRLIEPEWNTPRFAQYAIGFRLMPFVGPSGWSTTEQARAIGLRGEESQHLRAD